MLGLQRCFQCRGADNILIVTFPNDSVDDQWLTHEGGQNVGMYPNFVEVQVLPLWPCEPMPSMPFSRWHMYIQVAASGMLVSPRSVSCHAIFGLLG